MACAGAVLPGEHPSFTSLRPSSTGSPMVVALIPNVNFSIEGSGFAALWIELR